MAPTHATLDAAAQERKARLAKLKSLKRKQPSDESADEAADGAAPTEPTKEETPSVTTTYLSGRNYDAANRAPKLGFENAPDEDLETLERRAAEIELETRKKTELDQADEPIDLFKLQPKKPNWDLKRDVARKLERLNVRTENAIARLVRERILAQKKKQIETEGGGEGEKVGMQGEELVESLREREREEVEDERRENEDINGI
ncbi:MAG: hypothetical protein MMC23_000559 [Stictis urceolatum]|nr:hypothetical protein [Stictis urceolata]